MKLCVDAETVGPWVAEKTGGAWTPQRGAAIGKISDNTLVAGVIYEDFNKVNVVCHIAGEGVWATREFLNAIFDYPFNQLKVNRITVPVDGSNAKSIALVERLGFKIEARLLRATPTNDLLIYAMFKDDCKYIKGEYLGKIGITCNA